MIAYYLKLSLLSLKRNPILSALMILAIALGIGACMTTLTVDTLLNSHPIPEKEGKIFRVRFDIRLLSNNIDGDKEEDLPRWVTWAEATNIVNAERGLNQTAYQLTDIVVSPQNNNTPFFTSKAALVNWGFFPLTNAPFLYGTPWSKEMEKNAESIIVITKQMNDLLFDGEDSVGQPLLINGNTYNIVGVIDDWILSPKFYSGPKQFYGKLEQFYIPLSLKEPLGLSPSGNVLCYEGSGATDQSIEQIHASECVHLGLWVELDSPQDRSAYQEFLNNYVEEQRKLGRFPRTWEVSNMMTLSDWIEDQELAIKDTKVMIWLAISFLFICLLNTAVLLFGKLTQKRTEASLRRAVGASKQDLVIQYITEALLIGIFGGVLGIIFTYLGMLTMSFTYGEKLTRLISFDPYLVMTTVIVAVISTIAAGFIPAWKASTVAPATQLKSN